MGERSTILGKLTGTQGFHIVDPLHGARAQVGGEFLVAEDGEPSFRQSWNQSRHVMRLPVQLWKYSCAMMDSMFT